MKGSWQESSGTCTTGNAKCTTSVEISEWVNADVGSIDHIKKYPKWREHSRTISTRTTAYPSSQDSANALKAAMLKTDSESQAAHGPENAD